MTQDRMREALEPFAKIADDYDLVGKTRSAIIEGRTFKEHDNNHRVSISLGDCRRARKALSADAAVPSSTDMVHEPPAPWQSVLNRYRYSVDYAAADAWDGGIDIRQRFEWARANDPTRPLTENEVANIGSEFHAAHERGASPSTSTPAVQESLDHEGDEPKSPAKTERRRET